MPNWTEEQRRNAATCTLCGVVKPREEFYRDSRSGRGYTSRCGACIREARKRERQERGDHINTLRRAKYDSRRAKGWGLRSRYNISLEEFEAMAADGCAICNADEPNGKGWHVDHDHSCCPGGQSCGRCVRGVLCHSCNLLLGQARDSKEILLRAIEYLSGVSNDLDGRAA